MTDLAAQIIPEKQTIEPKTVRDAWDKASKAMAKERRQYWINLSFVTGEQWVKWDRQRQAIVEHANRTNRVRLTVNRMGSNLDNLVAKMLKAELSFEVLPDGGDDVTVAAARVAEDVLESARLNAGWEDIRADALIGSFVGGTSAVGIEWDAEAGDELGTLEDPMAGPTPVKGGECVLTPLTVLEFAVQPGVRSLRNATWWVRGLAMPPDEAREQYGLDYDPKPDSAATLSPLQQRLMGEVGKPAGLDLCLALTYYERPNGRRPEGVVVTTIGDKIVDGPHPWPFPFTDRLNLVTFRQKQVPGQWLGRTCLSDAVPLQVAYNAARSLLQEHMKLAGNARLMVPDGSLDLIEELSDEPGEVVPFNANSGNPFYLAPPSMPRWQQGEADQLKAELDDIMHVHDISRGVPGGADSGVALSLLAEKDDTPLGRMVRDQQAGWQDVGRSVLELLAAKVTEQRTARRYSPEGIPLARTWSGEELRGQNRVRVPLDAVRPHSRVAQQTWATNLWDRGVVQDPRQFMALAGVGGEHQALEVMDADASAAQVENTMMAAGRVPGTGDIPAPFPWDDHGIHIAEHNRFRKSREYLLLPEESQQVINDHVQAHEVRQAEEMAKQQLMGAMSPEMMQAPQANEPIGSTVPSDLAERQGGTPNGQQGPPAGQQQGAT